MLSLIVGGLAKLSGVLSGVFVKKLWIKKKKNPYNRLTKEAVDFNFSKRIIKQNFSTALLINNKYSKNLIFVLQKLS